MPLQIKLLGSLQIENENGTTSEIMKWAKGCTLNLFNHKREVAKSRASG